MNSTLIDRLLTESGYPGVTRESHEGFIRAPGDGVLFFTGDPNFHKETNDVAVVLPELVKTFGTRFRPAVVDRGSEVDLQKHYGFKTWPSLVFTRDGGWLGTISGIQNWADYVRDIAAILKTEPRQPPSFKPASAEPREREMQDVKRETGNV